MQHRPKKIRLGSWIALSALAHIGACGIYLLIATSRERFFDDDRIITVNIVQKGKKRDEKLLPRQIVQEPIIDAPKTPEKAIEKEIVSDAEPVPKPPLKPVIDKHALKTPENPKKLPPKSPNALEALEKRLKSLEKEGDEKGMDFGNSTSGDLYSYKAQIKSILDGIYRLPSFLGERERKTLLVKINILIDADGRPTKVRVTHPSKNAAFDDTVIAMVNSVVTFGPPPLPLRKQLKNQGQDVEWCPNKCESKE